MEEKLLQIDGDIEVLVDLAQSALDQLTIARAAVHELICSCATTEGPTR